MLKVKIFIIVLLMTGIGLVANAVADEQPDVWANNDPTLSIEAWVAFDIVYESNTQDLTVYERALQKKRVEKVVEQVLEPLIDRNELTEPAKGRWILANSVLVKATPKAIKQLERHERVMAVIPLDNDHK